MKETVSFKKMIFALLIGAFGVLAAFFPILLIPAAALIAFAGVCWGFSYAAIALFFTAAGAAAVNSSDWIRLIPAVVLPIGAALILTVGLRKKLAYRYIALALAALLFACLYCSIGLTDVIAGKAPYASITEDLSLIADAYKQSGTEEGSLLAAGVYDLSDRIKTAFYGVLILLSEAAALAMLLLARKFCLAGKAELASMAKFREWQLPPSMKIGLPVIAAGTAALLIAKHSVAYTVFYMVIYMLVPLFAAAGLGCMFMVADRRNRGFFKILALLMLLMSPFFVAAFGIFDLYANLRKRMIKLDRLIREAFERAEREHRSTVTVDFGDGRGPQVIAVRKNRNESAFFDNIPEPKDPTMEGDTGKQENAPGGQTDGDPTGSDDRTAHTETDSIPNDLNDNDDHENGGEQE